MEIEKGGLKTYRFKLNSFTKFICDYFIFLIDDDGKTNVMLEDDVNKFINNINTTKINKKNLKKFFKKIIIEYDDDDEKGIENFDFDNEICREFLLITINNMKKNDKWRNMLDFNFNLLNDLLDDDKINEGKYLLLCDNKKFENEFINDLLNENVNNLFCIKKDDNVYFIKLPN